LLDDKHPDQAVGRGGAELIVVGATDFAGGRVDGAGRLESIGVRLSLGGVVTRDPKAAA
jgi:hypothetical protein